MKISLNYTGTSHSVENITAKISLQTVASLFEEIEDDCFYPKVKCLKDLDLYDGVTTTIDERRQSQSPSVDMTSDSLVYTSVGKSSFTVKESAPLFSVRISLSADHNTFAYTILKCLIQRGVYYPYATRVKGLQKQLLTGEEWREFAGDPILAVRLGDKFPYSALVYADYALFSITEGEGRKGGYEWIILSNSPLPSIRPEQQEVLSRVFVGTQIECLLDSVPVVASQYDNMCWEGKWGVKSISTTKTLRTELLKNRESTYQAFSKARLLMDTFFDNIILDDNGVIIPFNDEILNEKL